MTRKHYRTKENQRIKHLTLSKDLLFNVIIWSWKIFHMILFCSVKFHLATTLSHIRRARPSWHGTGHQQECNQLGANKTPGPEQVTGIRTITIQFSYNCTWTIGKHLAQHEFFLKRPYFEFYCYLPTSLADRNVQ